MTFLILALFLRQDGTAQELIQTLRSDSVEERDAAAEKLQALGEAALKDLEQAAKSADVEVADRARVVIRAILEASGRKAMKRIEETLQRSKTLRVRFACESVSTPYNKGEKETRKYTGTLLLKDRVKVNLSLNRSEFAEILFIANGKKAWKSKAGSEGVYDDPKIPMAEFLSHTGVLHGTVLSLYASFDSMGHVYDLASSNSEDGLLTLTYKFRPGREDALPIYQTKVWYDPKTFFIRKRRMEATSPWQSADVCLTETYDEYAIDADIPEEKFERPGK